MFKFKFELELEEVDPLAALERDLLSIVDWKFNRQCQAEVLKYLSVELLRDSYNLGVCPPEVYTARFPSFERDVETCVSIINGALDNAPFNMLLSQVVVSGSPIPKKLSTLVLSFHSGKARFNFDAIRRLLGGDTPQNDVRIRAMHQLLLNMRCPATRPQPEGFSEAPPVVCVSLDRLSEQTEGSVENIGFQHLCEAYRLCRHLRLPWIDGSPNQRKVRCSRVCRAFCEKWVYAPESLRSEILNLVERDLHL